MCSVLVLVHDMTRLLEIHRNQCVSNGSDGLHWTTFQFSSLYCLHFRFHLTCMTRLPVTQVDSTVLLVLLRNWTPLDARFCPLESSWEYWTWLHNRRFLLQTKLKGADKTLEQCFKATCKKTLVNLFVVVESLLRISPRIINGLIIRQKLEKVFHIISKHFKVGLT